MIILGCDIMDIVASVLRNLHKWHYCKVELHLYGQLCFYQLSVYRDVNRYIARFFWQAIFENISYIKISASYLLGDVGHPLLLMGSMQTVDDTKTYRNNCDDVYR